MFKTQEKYRYQLVYASQCVNCKHEQTHQCSVSLYKNMNNEYECFNYEENL